MGNPRYSPFGETGEDMAQWPDADAEAGKVLDHWAVSVQCSSVLVLVVLTNRNERKPLSFVSSEIFIRKGASTSLPLLSVAAGTPPPLKLKSHGRSSRLGPTCRATPLRAGAELGRRAPHQEGACARMCLATAASVRLAFVASNVLLGARRLALQDYFFVKRSFDAHLRIVSGRSVQDLAHICAGPGPHLRRTSFQD